MAGQWCSICNSFHESRSSSACRRAQVGRGGGSARYPRATSLFVAPIFGVMAGFPVGQLTKNALAAVIVFVIVTAFAAWWNWPKKKKRSKA